MVYEFLHFFVAYCHKEKCPGSRCATFPFLECSTTRSPRLRDQHSTGQCWLHAGVGLLETVSEELTTRYPDVVYMYKQSLIRLVEWVHERLADKTLDERTRHILLEKGIDDDAHHGHAEREHGHRQRS